MGGSVTLGWQLCIEYAMYLGVTDRCEGASNGLRSLSESRGLELTLHLGLSFCISTILSRPVTQHIMDLPFYLYPKHLVNYIFSQIRLICIIHRYCHTVSISSVALLYSRLHIGIFTVTSPVLAWFSSYNQIGDNFLKTPLDEPRLVIRKKLIVGY